MPRTRLASFDRYARDVDSGKVVAGEFIRLACASYLADRKRKPSSAFPWTFDREKAQRAIDFIQLLPHVKGKWRGQPIKLEPWQAFAIANIFGWVHYKTGLRRYREAYIEVARKNGKSVLAAAVGVYMLCADRPGEGNEVYCGAGTERQAWEVFRPARLMCQASPDLAAHFNIEINAKQLLIPDDYSRFEPVVGDPGDGQSPSCGIVDEYHEHATPVLFETFQTGMGARDEGLLFTITTAGDNLAGPCYQERLDAINVLRGLVKDDRRFALIYTLDRDDDYTDPKVWKKANPNYGISLSRDYLKAQVASAQRSANKAGTIKTKHFNQWVGARDAWINLAQWKRAEDKSLSFESMAGVSGWLGLDLATRIDVAAKVALFRRQVDGANHYYAIPRFYVPEYALGDENPNAATYAKWVAEGHMIVHDGAEVDFGQIQADILAMPEKMYVVELAYDPWQSTQIAQAIREEGVEAVEYRNVVSNMSPPMKELEGALAAGRFHHDGNPVLTWMAANVVAKPDAKENIYPRKNDKAQKIDGIVALLFALGRAIADDSDGDIDDFLDWATA